MKTILILALATLTLTACSKAPVCSGGRYGCSCFAEAPGETPEGFVCAPETVTGDTTSPGRCCASKNWPGGGSCSCEPPLPVSCVVTDATGDCSCDSFGLPPSAGQRVVQACPTPPGTLCCESNTSSIYFCSCTVGVPPGENCGAWSKVAICLATPAAPPACGGGLDEVEDCR